MSRRSWPTTRSIPVDSFTRFLSSSDFWFSIASLILIWVPTVMPNVAAWFLRAAKFLATFRGSCFDRLSSVELLQLLRVRGFLPELFLVIADPLGDLAVLVLSGLRELAEIILRFDKRRV